MPCRTEQQDARYDTAISVLGWRAECHRILIKPSLQAEVNLLQLGFGRALSSRPAGQPRLAYVERGWKSKREEISALLEVLPRLAGLSSHTARPKLKFLTTSGNRCRQVASGDDQCLAGRFTERCHVFTFLCAQSA